MNERNDTARLIEETVERILADYLSDGRPDDGSAPEGLSEAIEESGIPLLLAAEDAGGAGLTLAEAHGVFRAIGRHAAPITLADAILANLPAGDEETEMRRGAAVRAVQIGGALESVLAITADYTRERVQFGRPIARFQAIQQALAELAGETAAAGVGARAALALAEKPSGWFEIAGAKIRAGEAASRAIAIAHQAHGAIGFTQEYKLHHFSECLWAWREDFGNESYWAERLGRAVTVGGADALWPRITSGPE